MANKISLNANKTEIVVFRYQQNKSIKMQILNLVGKKLSQSAAPNI